MKILRLFTLLIFCCILSTAPAQGATGKPVTISMPAETLQRTLSEMLPLPLEQNSKKFQGTITVDSISKLVIGNNLISVEGQVSGSNMQITTNIGGQDLKMKLGKLVLPITCDINLRFDPATKTMFLNPRFQNPTHGHSNSAKTLLPLLNSLGNKDYPVKLDSISPLNAKIGAQTISVRMEPIDIRAASNVLVLQLRPVSVKSR